MELLQARNVVINLDNVRNRVHETIIHVKRLIKCPPITRKNRRQKWVESDWQRVLFIDQPLFDFHSDSRRTKVWRRYGNCELLVFRYIGGIILF